MDAALQRDEQHISLRSVPAQDRSEAAPKADASARTTALGALYAHALAVQYEAEVRYCEFATFMADYGNDAAADLFLRLTDFVAQRAFALAKRSMGIEIPVIDPAEYAWLDSGMPVAEARAFVYRLMTPRGALEIALHAQEQAKAYFERIQVESRNAGVRALASEFACEEQAHIDWISNALAHLPRPFWPDEELLGDPTIEQEV